MNNIFKTQIQNENIDISTSNNDALDMTVTQHNNVIAYNNTRIITVSPDFLRSKRIIAGLEPGAVTDAYRLLRTQVLQRMREQKWNTLAITSSGLHEGKDVTAINLAVSMAMEVNQTVLLVDLDLRQPSLHEYFDYLPEQGLSDHLKIGTSLDEILFNPSIERLVVLPGRDRIYNSSEMLSSPAMINLVEELKARYANRVILFVLPPLLGTDDALAFSPYVDAVLLVIDEGKTATTELASAMEMMQSVNVIGTVLNKDRD